MVEDEARLATALQRGLQAEGFAVDLAHDGEDGLHLAREGAYDALVLDLMLPEVDGLEVCKRIREHSRIPIVMLTARGDETDRVVGLELGADDYLPKPFGPRELLARMRAVLRRSLPGPARSSGRCTRCASSRSPG